MKAIADAAHADNLPVVSHTGNARDVEDAVNAGVNGIEHGSFVDAIPEAVFAKMKQLGIAYDPTLTVVEAFTSIGQGKFDVFDRTPRPAGWPQEVARLHQEVFAISRGRQDADRFRQISDVHQIG